jgi:hypothetical protein
MDASSAEAWAKLYFGRVDLEHEARRKRAEKFAAQMMQSPAASIPSFCVTKGQAKAAYMFLSNPEVEHEALLSGVVEETLSRCSACADVLVIQDTTAVSFGGASEREDLGPINDSKVQGMLVHTALAVSAATREVLGVLEQHVWSRSKEKRPRDESARARRGRTRESERWSSVQRRVAERLGESGVSAHVIAVYDREGDIFEVFEECDEIGHSFVIRATHNRLLESESDESLYSRSEVRRAPVIAHRTVNVPARGGGRGARQAALEIRALRVDVQPPKNRDRRGSSQWMNLVLVEEVNPPSAKEALHWFLVTREPIDTAEQVLAIVEIYETRWVIEEFHMGLKTGCALEERQLESAHALKNFLAFATAASVSLLRMRDASRNANLRASDVLSPIQLEILGATHPKVTPESTANAAFRAVAQLGGFMGTSAKQPGWRTLWRGFSKILQQEKGYLLALKQLQERALASPTSTHKTGAS